MTVYPSSRMQAERTIAAGRVALAASSLFAVWIDPAEPARFAQATYGLLLSTSRMRCCSQSAPGAGGRNPPADRHAHRRHHGVRRSFQYLTLGPSSPFFLYFMFSMFCGAIRWGPRGTLTTGGVVIVTYAVMTMTMSQTLGRVAK